MAQDAPGGLAGSIQGLQGVLEQLYNNMIPQCSQLIGVGRAVAGFGATWYIAYRVWGHIARAEPIDFYPLLRPFAFGLAILNFPFVIAVINGIMQPAASQTSAWVNTSNAAIAALLKEKEEAYKTTTAYQMYLSNNGEGDKDAWEKYSGDADNSWIGGLTNSIRFALDKAAFNLKNTIKVWLSEVLQLLYEAAALCINTIRTFYLIILAIIGPLVFGLSVFDGFGHTLRHWLAKYINVFLWLPVCNIFGAIVNTIQEQMIQLDINQIKSAGDTAFGATDTGYLIFLIIAIAGYFTVPSVAGYIVSAGGHSLLSRTNLIVSHVTSQLNLPGQHSSSQVQQVMQGPVARAASGGSFGAGTSGGSDFQYRRVKGS
ncbi:MAG: conjugative transposon protein TraJ [Sphingobacteriales bacterium 50-39]|nr:MAG: conjugative transposon protein TraJ [Sphingobacteriales bacterium 50-39]